MDIITSLSKGTVKFINNHDLINKTFTQEDYTYIEKLIKKYRHKEAKITEVLVKQLAENGAMIFYGELFKYLIVLSIASYFGIFLSTFVIMNAFSFLRSLAGGVHMSTFNRCFAVMIGFFLSLGYLVNQIYINSIVTAITVFIGYIWSIYSAYKYSPQERPDKSDKDCDNGNKKKYTTVIFIAISFSISMILIAFTQQKLISMSIFTGVLLEMFTITPWGTRLFQWIDRVGGKEI